MTNSPTFSTHSCAVFDAVERATESVPGIDVERAGNILAFRFEDGGRCTLNRQDAIEQIWLADGPLSWHFECDAPTGHWSDTVGRGSLFHIFGAMLHRRLGRAVRLVGANG